MSTLKTYRIEHDALNELIQTLRNEKYIVIGPTPRGGAIVLDEITAASQLPIGKTDEQSPAQYHLKDRTDQAYFGFSAGPHSWKRYLFPPVFQLFAANRDANGFHVADGGGHLGWSRRRHIGRVHLSGNDAGGSDGPD